MLHLQPWARATSVRDIRALVKRFFNSPEEDSKFAIKMTLKSSKQDITADSRKTKVQLTLDFEKKRPAIVTTISGDSPLPDAASARLLVGATGDEGTAG